MQAMKNSPAQLTQHALKQMCESGSLKEDMDGIVVAVQVVDVTIFSADKAKKNIKGRVTLSDGVSKVICMLPEKTFDTMASQGKEVRKFDVWMLDAGKQQCQVVNNKPVMILRSTPEVFGKDINREIGAPQDYSKNKEADSFPDSYDLKLPGAQHSAAFQNEEIEEVEMNEGANNAASPVRRNPEESKRGREIADAVMVSSSSVKQARPASAYMPIKALNQFTNDWTIKARVVKKAAIKSWKNARGSGQLLNFDLVDREGTMIQGTAFNDQAVYMDGILELDAIFTFSNGFVKLANKRFTSIKNDYCLTFSKDSICEKCADDEEIQSVSFTFTGLDRIEELVQSHTVDVIGVLLDVGQPSSINMKDGKTREKRTLTIGDESNVCINVTLWGSVVEAHRYNAGQVIAFKSCRVSDFNGKSLNASSHGEDIFIGSIRHPRADELKQWSAGQTMNDLRGEMRALGEAPDRDGQRKASKTPTLLIAQLQKHVQEDADVSGGKPFYCNLNCDLSWVFVPEGTDRQMFYNACEVCKKKVMKDHSGAGYNCESCMRSYENCVPTYNFSIRVSDCSGSLMLGCFGEIGETILGINAQEFFAMHEDTFAVKDMTMNRLHQQPLAMVVRAKVDNERFSESGPSVRYTAVRAASHSYAHANENLLMQLKAYGSQPEVSAQPDEGVCFF